MPEMPPGGYQLYRFWGRLPAAAGRWNQFVAWLAGNVCRLLYVGITCRGATRWLEHDETKSWFRDVIRAEFDPDLLWPTLHDAVIGPDGQIVLVWDPALADGWRPARPAERVAPHPRTAVVNGEPRPLWLPHPDGQPVRGRTIEGALTGELRRIRAEAPIHNKQGNEGNRLAVHRVRRILPAHVAAWRRQAATLTCGWTILAAILTWALHTGAGPVAALNSAARGIGLSAVAILAAGIARRATQGRVNLAMRRRQAYRRRRRRR